METPLVIYCYDAYCGWCYGFSPVIKRIAEEYRDKLRFEVLSGGMILSDKPAHVSAIAGFVKTAYKTVEERTGIRFGEDFLWHMRNPDLSDWFPNSEKPAIALCIFKDIYPGKQVEFASDLQYALNYEGRDLCDDEAYRYLLEKYGIDEKLFYEKLRSQEFKEKAYYEFALVKQLRVTGFPAVLVQASETKFYLLSRGYTDYPMLKERIDNILAELEIVS
jgi:putative protein-disulfide isomerase